MAKFLSDRQRSLSVGIANYTEGSTVLDVTGDIGVSGIVTAKTGAAVTYYGDGSNLTGITASQVGAIADIITDITPQLGGNLDLNGNDITGTGNINLTGVITATSFSGDGSNLTGIAVSSLQFNDSSISIATTDGSIIFKSNNVIVASISSETAYWRVPLNLNNNKITNLAAPSSLSDAANKDYVDNQVAGDFPTGDYGDLSSGDTDAFGQIITDFVTFDCLTTPSGSLATEDLGALT